MEEPSDGASPRPESDCVQAPTQWRQVVMVAEYIPKVQGEPRRTLWRLNSSNMGKYQGPKEPAGVPLDLHADIVESSTPEEPAAKVTASLSSEEENADRCNARRKRRQPVDADDMFKYHECSRNRVVGLKGHKAKVAEYMTKVRGEPKRKLWHSNYHSSDMYKYRGHSWPRVVGLDVNEAKRIIGEGKPELYFQVLPQYGLRTLEGSPTRVRLLVDKYNRIAETPRVG